MIRELKKSSDLVLRIVRVENAVLAAWTDSSLCGSDSDPLEIDDEEINVAIQFFFILRVAAAQK